MNSSTVLKLISRKLRPHFRTWVRQLNFEGEIAQTRVNMMSQEDDNVIYIEAFSSHGFRLNNKMRIHGPCAVFPRSVLHWGVPSSMAINEESLSLFCMLEPKLDILVLGIGDKDDKCDRVAITKYLQSKKINVEIKSTENACAVFNFLNSERRFVAAGLLPPQNYLIQDEDDVLTSQMEQRNVFHAKGLGERPPDHSGPGFFEEEVPSLTGLKGPKRDDK